LEALSKPKTSSRNKVQFNLRIDPELLEWIKNEGKKYERPANYVINHAIKQLKKASEANA
jgi:uncharacterized protein (DUF4415 family)